MRFPVGRWWRDGQGSPQVHLRGGLRRAFWAPGAILESARRAGEPETRMGGDTHAHGLPA